MREDSRPVQRVINALGRRDAVEACGLADGPIVLAMRHSQPRKLWCLNLKTARKVLIIKDSKIETAEVGLKALLHFGAHGLLLGLYIAHQLCQHFEIDGFSHAASVAQGRLRTS
jgi:hypothetical protein